MSSGGGGGGIGGIGSAIGGIVGGVIGGNAQSGDKSQAQGYAEDAMNQLISIGVPPDLSKQLILEKFQAAGQLTPEMEQAINVAHSKVADMTPETTGRTAQVQALQQLQQLGKTGLGAQDRAALSQIRNQVQSDMEGKRQQILQNMQARGMGGSGAELIAQLQGAQGGANSEAQQGLDVGAQAQTRALQAITQGANLGGNIQSADTSLATTKAQAADELNRFNVQNQMAQQQRNVQAQNQVQQMNLANQQAIGNANVSQANQETERANEAQRQNWLDQITRAKTISGGYQGLSNEYNNRANQEMANSQNMWTGIGGLVGQGVSALGSIGGGASSGNAISNVNQNSPGAFSAGGGGTSNGGYYSDPSAGSYYQGGLVGEDGKVVHPDQMRHYDEGGYVGGEVINYQHGGIVPGKAIVPGNSLRNDIVPAMVSPGEVILPREVMRHPNAPEEAKRFIHKILSYKKS